MGEPFDSSSGDGWDTDDDSCAGETGGARRRGEGPSPRRNSGLINSSATAAGVGAMDGPPRGTLRLDKTQAMAGEVVGVYWDIPSVQTSAGDWIAIYERGRSLSLSLPSLSLKPLLLQVKKI